MSKRKKRDKLKTSFIKACVDYARGPLMNFNQLHNVLVEVNNTCFNSACLSSLKKPHKIKIVREFNKIWNNPKVLKVMTSEKGVLEIVTQRIILKNGMDLGHFIIRLTSGGIWVSSFVYDDFCHPCIYNGRILHPKFYVSVMQLLREYKYSTIIDLCIQVLSNPPEEYSHKEPCYRDLRFYDPSQPKVPKGIDKVCDRIESFIAFYKIHNEFNKAHRILTKDRTTNYYDHNDFDLSLNVLKGFFESKKPISQEVLGIEYDNLIKRNDIEKVSFDNDVFIVNTKEVTIRFRNNIFLLGKYTLSISLRNQKILIHNNTPLRSEEDACIHHPHVDVYGQPCFGNISSLLEDLLHKGKISVIVDLLMGYLKSYNMDSPYYRLGLWPKRTLPKAKTKRKAKNV